MLNIDTGLIFNINYYQSNNNVTILTSKNGFKIVSLTEINQYWNKYNVLDYWTFIFIEDNSCKLTCIPYEKLNSFINLKNHKLVKLFNKIVTNSYEKHNNERIFNFLMALYTQLNINPNLDKVYVFFLFHSLLFQGIQLNLSSCINCNQSANLYLVDYSLGGVFCKTCSIKRTTINFDIKLFISLFKLQFFNYREIDNWKINSIEIKKIINILENHCQYYLP